MRRKLALLLIGLAALMSVSAGLRYLMLDEFLLYHSVVAGRPWAEIEPGIQAIIIGMLRIVGGGFLACGVVLFWLIGPIRRGEVWARWAAISTVAAVWGPAQYVTLSLKSISPAAQPPIAQTALIIGLAALGLLISTLRRSRRPRR